MNPIATKNEYYPPYTHTPPNVTILSKTHVFVVTFMEDKSMNTLEIAHEVRKQILQQYMATFAFGLNEGSLQ